MNQFGFDLYFSREYLKAGLVVSLLSVWVLVGLFYYLNHYTKRRYFTIWATAWLFYALWITLRFGFQGAQRSPLLLMVQQWCVGVSAVFLLWGGLRFLGRRVRQTLLALFLTFLLTWSYIGAYHLVDLLQVQLPIFGLIGICSIMIGWCFFEYRRKREFVGATLLSLGFLLWGVYLISYPFLENSEDLISLALFISAVLQLFLAVSMIILVLEEVRHTHQLALHQVHSRKIERDALQTKVFSTEERYRNLFDQAGDAIVITNAENLLILEINRAAERVLGVSRAEAARHTLNSFCQMKIDAHSTPITGADWFEVIRRQQPLTLMKKNGELKPFEVDAAPLDFDGQPAYQFLLRELTERARLEQQLRQAEKLAALGQMISGIAHELNNPLAVIKGYLELILDHHQLSSQTRADLGKVVRESNRAAKLVMNFLSLAREQPARRDLVNLNELIQRVVELRKIELRVAKTELLLELDPHLPPTAANADQIQQLLINLMNNALQAMVDSHRPGCLKIRTQRNGELIQILVEDNGPGVPPELETKIFEPFFTTKEVGTGTGLGLSIAHGIMTDHNGRIFYQTSSLGGAAFVLEFPVVTEPIAGTTTPDTTFFPASVGAPPARAGDILVLDDEPAIAEMLGEILSLLGHNPTLSHAPAHALELLGKQDFDLIISDFRMPGLNGQQFYELATKKKPYLARRIIFLTGDVVNEETQVFLRSTGNPHLTKPFKLAKIRKIVTDLMQENSSPEPAAKNS